MTIKNADTPMTPVQYAQGVVYKFLGEAEFWHEGSIDVEAMTQEEIEAINKEVKSLIKKMKTAWKRITKR